MVSEHLHIISLNVPYPPNYGGVIDIYYKVKALSQLGIKVHLHCFSYGREENAVLDELCEKVYYYKRKTGFRSNLSLWPYITYSRRSRKLLQRLKEDDYPILYEGLHTAYSLVKRQFADRVLLFRAHNMENDYYNFLAKQEPRFFLRLYYRKEALLLKRMLARIPANTCVGAISPEDTRRFLRRFKQSFWLPPFHANEELQCKEGLGEYVLYHGNLSVPENISAAKLLVHQFGNKDIALVVAGKDPDHVLQLAIASSANIRLVPDPDVREMDDLIQNAQVILLPTQQATGIKLKLLDSLYKGRHCVCNTLMVEGTMLEELCEIVHSDKDFYTESEKLMELPFCEDKISKRRAVLLKHYDNRENAVLLQKKLEQLSES